MFEILSQNLSRIGFLPILLIIYLLGLFIFWLQGKKLNKNSNSIFDQWFVTTLFMLVWGRFIYIIASWESLSNWYWFWLPYEKYGNQMYFLRAMPWRIFAIWDGGFLFIAMFVVFLLSNFIYTVFVKRWRWKEMMSVIYITANSMLGLLLFVYGIFIKSDRITQDGVYLGLYTLLFVVMTAILKFVYKTKEHAFTKLVLILNGLFVVGSVLLVSYIFLTQELSKSEVYHVYGFIVISGFLLLYYLLDIRKGDEVAPIMDSDDRYHSITLNQAIKIRND